VLLEHQFQATDGEQRAVGTTVVTDYCADYDAAASKHGNTVPTKTKQLAEHHANKAAIKHGNTVPTKTAEQKLHDAYAPGTSGRVVR
jgi:hypothetical protein